MQIYANTTLWIVHCVCCDGLITGAMATDFNASWNPLYDASSGNLVFFFVF